jgi:hypothetical protein
MIATDIAPSAERDIRIEPMAVIAADMLASAAI